MPLARCNRLGPYAILEPIGAGGMGEVYRARDSRLDRDVAVKVLPPHLAEDAQARARFEREAKTIAALSHPNLLAIYDVGYESGIAFAVTELLEGETLRQRLESSGVLSWRKALEIGVPLSEGLAAAHAKNIVHRDLKPDNVFLTSDGRVKLLDFGLARAAPDASLSLALTRDTKAGTILGTMGYMSPEQARGLPSEAASDIFAFGCVLYEMVTGVRAFWRSSAAESIAAVLREDPPPVRGSGIQVPPELERVIAHCLEKNPRQRYQSAHDLAFSLKALLTDSGTTRAAAVETDAGVDSLAVLPFANAGDSPDTEYLSEGITESLINALSQLPRLRVAPRSRVFRYRDRDIDPIEAGRELNVRAVLTGRVLQRGDNLTVQAELTDVTRESQLWGERYHRKFADIFEIEEEIPRQIASRLRLKLGGEPSAARRPQSSEAYELYLKGRHHWNKRTKDGMLKAVHHFELAIAKDPRYALAYAGLSDCYYVLAFYSFSPPLDLLAKARAAAQKGYAVEPDSCEINAVLSNALAAADYDWDTSERHFRRALEINPQSALAHDWYALHLAARGRHAEAIAEIQKAQELEPLWLVTYHHGAWVYLMARQYDRVAEQMRYSADLDPSFVVPQYWHAAACTVTGQAEEAVRRLQSILQSIPATFVEGALAHAHAVAGHTAEALDLITELTSRKAYLEPYSIALAYTGLGDRERAFEWLEKAIVERSPWMPMFGKADARLDPLRDDPRYAGLLRRVSLETG